jgi:predicted RNA-binding Zn ribbon-like protein
MGPITVDADAMNADDHAPFEPITDDERDRWHADARVRKLLNQAAALGLHEFRSTVESLRRLERLA